MSAPRQEDATDEHMKLYLMDRLELEEQRGHSFVSHIQFIEYLHIPGSLGKLCEEWIDKQPMGVFRELLEDHNRRGKDRASAVQAPSLNGGGPPVPCASNVPSSDSGIDACSPMRDQPIYDYDSEQPAFDVFCVPIAVPDARFHSLRARIDKTRGENIIDLECAKTLCGNQVELHSRVKVRYRSEEDDPNGTKTYQTVCVVGRIQDENIVFSREPPWLTPDLRSGYPVGNFLPQELSGGQAEDVDDPEFIETRREEVSQMIMRVSFDMAKERMQKKRRTPDDEDGRHHPARRTRTSGQ